MNAGSELVGAGTVLESPGAGPHLCLGVVLASLPPQGGGPVITNWDWSVVSGHTTVSGTTWGAYTVIGTYDGHSFTTTRPPREYVAPATEPGGDLDRLRTPCPEPSGGWRVLDPSRTTEEALSRLSELARGLEGYASMWLDQSLNPVAQRRDEEAARLMNDPAQMIINVAVTGDAAVAEARLREVWGGPLCVSTARHTDEELSRVRDELVGTPGMLTLGHFLDHVDLEVVYDDGSLQREVDARFGEGLVVITSALRLHPG